MGDGDGPFVQLRRIANGFEELDVDLGALAETVRITGRCALPLLCRELAGACDRRRAIARRLLAGVDTRDRDRLIDALHAVARGAAHDAGKAAALGLLAELGVATTAASFADPRDVQRRSAAQLAAHLETRGDVASAADLLVHELDTDDLINVVEAMADAAPERTSQLVAELSARLDLDGAVRSELRRIVAPLAIAGAASRSPGATGRPALLAVLEDGDGRRVVLVSRRAGTCWRNFAALIDATGVLLDCLYEDETTPDVLARDVIGTLIEQGYARRPAAIGTARLVVAAAARRAAASARGLPSTYYLGRDLLGLGDLHLGQRARASELATLHGRAVDVLAGGDAARARPLLEHCARIAADDPDVASSLGLCLLALAADDDPDAIAVARDHLARAAQLEPTWDLHHWNLAAACHRAGDLAACWRALRDFVATAGAGLGDPAHADRLAVAHRFVTDFERAAHLAGERLPDRRARRRAAKPRPA